MRFTSDPGVTLSGTLFVSEGPGRHPAIVLFHGSGPEARNDRMARWFARHGLTALAYDKRGVGESTGDFRTVPFMTLCDDGLAAVSVLKQRGDVDPERIGVWGLSQGGWLGPLAAARSSDVRFVIAVSGPLVSPGEQMVFFYANQLRHDGFSERDIEDATALRRRVWHYLSTHEGAADTEAALARAAGRPWFAAVQQQLDGTFRRSASDILHDASLAAHQWYQLEMNYDPTAALKRLRVPALFLYGDRDEITPVPASVAALRSIAAGNRNIEVTVLSGADHAMFVEHGEGRAVDEAYLDRMAAWLRGTLSSPRRWREGAR